jgi:hypothetical protein
MSKDWTGNTNSVLKCLASSHHTTDERQREDYYATDPKAAHLLMSVEPTLSNIWECACGEKHLAKVFADYGVLGRASDLVDRCDNETLDFLSIDNIHWEGDIATNPPYKYAQEFIEKALSIVDDGHYVCMFLKVTFLEGKRRKELFRQHPPKTIYVSSSRINCAKNGEFDGLRETGGSAVAYAWYVWQKGFKGATIIKWIN